MAFNSQGGKTMGRMDDGHGITQLTQQDINTIVATVQKAQSYISQEYLSGLGSMKIVSRTFTPQVQAQCIGKFMYDKHEDVVEKLAGVYSALHTYNSSYAMMIRGTPADGTKVYMCSACASNMDGKAQRLLERCVKGYFPGTEMENEEVTVSGAYRMVPEQFVYPNRNKSVFSVSLYPGRRSGEEHMIHGSNLTVQGMEKLIDMLKNSEYTMVVLAEPVPTAEIERRLKGLRELYSTLSAYAKESIAVGENDSRAMANSVSKTNATALSSGISSSYGTNRSRNTGGSYGNSSGSGVSLFGVNFNSGSQSSSVWGEAAGENEATAQSHAKVETDSTGRMTGITVTTGNSRTLTYTRENKLFTDLLQKIEYQINHLERERVQGMWDTCCYVIAPGNARMTGAETATMAVSAYVSLVSGENAISEHCHINQWTDKSSVDQIIHALRCLEHPTFMAGNINGQFEVSPALSISSRELVIMASLPRRSINGMQVDSMAEFGRSFPPDWQHKNEAKFDLGWITHMGEEDPNAKLTFLLQTFSSHVFLTGASGSGKSNTAWHLISRLKGMDVQNGSGEKIKIMIIEPVKGEYKRVFGNEFRIYCAHPKKHRQLRINPFEFSDNVDISEHMSALCDILSACWPLYGPMPGILKEAIERCYLSCGWDLSISQRVCAQKRKYPDFHDLLQELNNVLEESSYSKQTRGDYIGAMTMRVRSLVNGFEGQIFCSDTSLSDSDLFEENVLIDLSSIASAETRALVMGVLIMRLKEYRHCNADMNNAPLKHVTVLEEAHTLLKRCSLERQQDSSNIQAASVQMISEAIAEMRSYGEGFMIIDQSPTVVDISAIKNTAIKIVMRLPEKRDCEDIGNALSLNEEQMLELSRLKRGVAAVYHEGWDRTVLAKMDNAFIPSRVYKPSVVTHEEMIRLRGAAVSVLIAQRKAFIVSNRDYQVLMRLDQNAKRLLRTPVFMKISRDKHSEVMQAIQKLMLDFGVLQRQMDRNTALNRLDEMIGSFLLDFLQLRSLLRMLPMPGKPARVGDERYYRKLIKWYDQMVNAMGNYLTLCDVSDGGRISDREENAMLKDVTIWVLQGYTREQVEKGNSEFSDVLTMLRMRL